MRWLSYTHRKWFLWICQMKEWHHITFVSAECFFDNYQMWKIRILVSYGQAFLPAPPFHVAALARELAFLESLLGTIDMKKNYTMLCVLVSDCWFTDLCLAYITNFLKRKPNGLFSLSFKRIPVRMCIFKLLLSFHICSYSMPS